MPDWWRSIRSEPAAAVVPSLAVASFAYGLVVVAGIVGGVGPGFGFCWYENSAITESTFDHGDDRLLVAFASDVFLGRVRGRVGAKGLPTSEPGHSVPRTRFAVDVLEPIKGAPPPEVVVSQYGGCDPRTGAAEIVDGDPMLRSGETALFVTRRNEGEGWYTIVAPGHGDVRVRDDRTAAALVARFRRAAEDGPAGTVGSGVREAAPGAGGAGDRGGRATGRVPSRGVWAGG